MLVSNVVFSLNTHYCGGKAVKTSFSIGLHNPDCGMAETEPGCGEIPAQQGNEINQKPCCENTHQVIQMDEDADISSSKVSINPAFVIAFTHAFVHALLYADPTLVHNTDYVPPIPDRDIQVLFQSFLI